MGVVGDRGNGAVALVEAVYLSLVVKAHEAPVIISTLVKVPRQGSHQPPLVG